ncbi:hypothetical protein FDG2_5832 [Candidatus Protofrankia californiensis]|uniref:CopG family transcriptional regulator n=1 Tax=Candidatus Protofrankia californiensis TaxID=1839754 RepID=A0A1C3PFR3_9ACTN|nr:hypothetical protein FDG2_5832 [Candidatus Protofrankia californiensis]
MTLLLDRPVREFSATCSYRWYEQIDYGDGMAVAKVSVSLDERVLTAARAAAATEGVSLSAWISRLIDQHIGIQEGLAAVREYEAEHGPIPEEVLRRADEILDRLGVGRRS